MATWLKSIVNWLKWLFQKPGADTVALPLPDVAPREPAPPLLPKSNIITTPPGWWIDWANSKAKVSKYFTVAEATYLHKWDRLAQASDGLDETVKDNLIKIFAKMDLIREILRVPLLVRSAYRPRDYNVFIGGAKLSAHMATDNCAAVDFWTDQNGDGEKTGEDCDAIKALLMPRLKELGVRMEDNGKGARWVHLDNRPVLPGKRRFFKP